MKLKTGKFALNLAILDSDLNSFLKDEQRKHAEWKAEQEALLRESNFARFAAFGGQTSGSCTTKKMSSFR